MEELLNQICCDGIINIEEQLVSIAFDVRQNWRYGPPLTLINPNLMSVSNRATSSGTEPREELRVASSNPGATESIGADVGSTKTA